MPMAPNDVPASVSFEARDMLRFVVRMGRVDSKLKIDVAWRTTEGRLAEQGPGISVA